MKQKLSVFSIIKVGLCFIVFVLVLYSCFQSSDSEIIDLENSGSDIIDNTVPEKSVSQEDLYLEAERLLANQQYDEALSIFESLETYKDSMYHAEGIRCMDYATNLANELSYSNATFGIVGGLEMYYEYSPENYTFTSIFEIPKDGLLGILAGIGTAMGEETDYNRAEMKKMAEELYYEHFALKGYYYIKCAYEVRDHATDNYLLETFTPTEDIPDATSEFYSFHEAVDSYFGIERVEIHTWDSYNPQDADIMTYIYSVYRQATLNSPLSTDECKDLIYQLSGYFWSIDSLNKDERASLYITDEYIKDINDIHYTYKILGAYEETNAYVMYIVFDAAPESLCILYINSSFQGERYPDLTVIVPREDGLSDSLIFSGLKL